MWSYENIELFVKIGHIKAELWTHIACTFDGTTIRAYQDGNICTSMEVSFSNPSNPNPIPDPNLNSNPYPNPHPVTPG